MKHTLRLLTHDFRTALAGAQPPCLSLYQTTHRHHPENQQDPIRFRNLTKELEQSLRQKHPAGEVSELLAPFDALASDAAFWNHTMHGLAVFSAAGAFHVFGLQRPVAEVVVVADSFHTKPLWRILQTADRYQVLALTRQEIRLFEGNRDALDEIDLAPGVPRTITEALGEELTEKHQTVASYGGVGGGSVAMRHGHGGKADEVDVDTERFFRAIDRAVLEHHSRPAGIPLVLAALPEYHGHFRQLSQNPFLAPAGVATNPQALSTEELRTRSWEVMEPQFHARTRELVEAYGQAESRDLGSDDLEQVAEAAAAGRAETLLIEADRQIPGRMDATTGKLELGELGDPGVDDLLDDLGDLIASKGGRVLVVPAGAMPSTSGLAATYRY